MADPMLLNLTLGWLPWIVCVLTDLGFFFVLNLHLFLVGHCVLIRSNQHPVGRPIVSRGAGVRMMIRCGSYGTAGGRLLLVYAFAGRVKLDISISPT